MCLWCYTNLIMCLSLMGIIFGIILEGFFKIWGIFFPPFSIHGIYVRALLFLVPLNDFYHSGQFFLFYLLFPFFGEALPLLKWPLHRSLSEKNLYGDLCSASPVTDLWRGTFALPPSMFWCGWIGRSFREYHCGVPMSCDPAHLRHPWPRITSEWRGT